jgi:hypothetical protein
MAEAGSRVKIPVTILTGFLGSGKTTLLNRILQEQHGRRIASVVTQAGLELVAAVDQRAEALSAPEIPPRLDNAMISLLDLPAMTLGWAEGRAWKCASDAAKISMPSVVALPHQCDRIWRGVRTATRKLVLNEDGSPWLFFDLERDRLEQMNLAGDAARAGEIEALRATCD